MVKLKKSVKALRAEDFDKGETVIEKGKILKAEIRDTEFGERTLLTVEDQEDEEEKPIFLNSESQDNLIEAYGEESDDWHGKLVSVTCERGKGKYKNNMLIVKAQK
jgi:hypothetical protein